MPHNTISTETLIFPFEISTRHSVLVIHQRLLGEKDPSTLGTLFSTVVESRWVVFVGRRMKDEKKVDDEKEVNERGARAWLLK